MLILERKNNEVFYNGAKLTVVAQASKGPNKEVVKIKDLPEANGQTWISLSRLKEGINEIDNLKPREHTSNSYTLTNEEKQEIEQLEKRIEEIKENARKRVAPKIDLKQDISKLSQEEKDALANQLEIYLQSLKNN